MSQPVSNTATVEELVLESSLQAEAKLAPRYALLEGWSSEPNR